MLEVLTVGVVGQVQILQRGDHVLVHFDSQSQLVMGEVQDVGEYFRVGLITHVSWKSSGGKKLPNRDKGGVLTIGHGGDTLDEKGMAGIEIDGIVGVLPPLSQHHPGLKFLAIQL